MKTLLNKLLIKLELLIRFNKRDRPRLAEYKKPISPDARIYESYEAYLRHKPYNKKYLISLDVKPHLGGYMLRAHTGRKSIRKFFLNLSDIRSWLEENSFLKPKESCTTLLVPKTITLSKEK